MKFKNSNWQKPNFRWTIASQPKHTPNQFPNSPHSIQYDCIAAIYDDLFLLSYIFFDRNLTDLRRGRAFLPVHIPDNGHLAKPGSHTWKNIYKALRGDINYANIMWRSRKEALLAGRCRRWPSFCLTGARREGNCTIHLCGSASYWIS